LRQFLTFPEVEIVGVCDVDGQHLDAAAKTAGGGVFKTREYREILDRKEVDAVVVSPPAHWHAIPTLRALEAEKDVYVEKPLGHNIREGRAVVEAAKQHKRLVTIGLQQRSGPHFIEAVKRIRGGELGKVSFVHAWNAWGLNGMGSQGPEGFGNPPDSDPPPWVDYDRWLGPAPKRRFNPRRFHFYFYFFWDYSGGMVSAWGVHLFDIVLWAMGKDILNVTSTGGKYVYRDSRETPDTLEATFECPGYTLAYSMRHGSSFPYHGSRDHGIMFFGTKAMLRIDRESFEIFPEGEKTPSFVMRNEGQDIPHKKNFLRDLRERRKPAADALVGHLAAIPGHLANISWRVGRRLEWDGEKETVPGDTEAQALLQRRYRDPYSLFV
jgi:predicted dehydrogenase